MNCREYAENRGVQVVGKLQRMPDRYYGVQYDRYPWFLDDAGNEYIIDVSGGKWVCSCIVTADGRII